MRTYDIHTEDGELLAFEVDNLLLMRVGAIRVVKSIPGVKIISARWVREDVFCRFELSGREFMVEEPWGDNSRYCIGPMEPVEPTEQIKQARAAFQSAGILGFRRGGG